MSRAVCNLGLTGLDDPQVIELYESIGARNYGLGVSLGIKLAEFEMLLDELWSDQGPASAIDFGCATGLLPVFLRKHGLVEEMAGLDGCQCYIEAGQELCEQEGTDVKFINSYANKAPLADMSYDVAYCIDLLDCSRNWRSIVKEMTRVARQKVIVIYTMTSLFRRIDPLDVLNEISEAMVVDPPRYFNPAPLRNDGRVCTVITATRKGQTEDSNKLVIARATI
ncbi:MAG: class I SAM-dependent methyltransferase [Patescibacteria group bacterium]|nr:class I SAM-dependent methyltransferase [Patescibacteria group bacterium]